MKVGDLVRVVKGSNRHIDKLGIVLSLRESLCIGTSTPQNFWDIQLFDRPKGRLFLTRQLEIVNESR